MKRDKLIELVTEHILESNYDSAIQMIELQIKNDSIYNNRVKIFNECLMDAVCFYFNITEAQLKEKNSTRFFVDARRIYSKLLRQKGYTYEKIGNFLNGRDHSTIIHYCKNFNNLIKYDKDLKRKYDDIKLLIE